MKGQTGNLFRILLFLCILQPILINAQQTGYHVLFDSLENKIVFLEKLPKHEQIDFFGSLQEDIARAREMGKLPQGLLNRIQQAEARNYFLKGEYKKAIPLLTGSLEYAADLKDSLTLLTHLSKAYISLNNLPKAFEVQNTVDNLRKRKTKDVNWLFVPRLSALYYHFSMYREAITQAKLELRELKQYSNDHYFFANFNNDLGLFYAKAGLTDSAIYFYNKALNLVPLTEIAETQKLFFSGLIKGNIAQALMNQGKYRQAIPLLQEDIKYSWISKNFDNAAISHNELAKCYMELRSLEPAQKHLDSAYKILHQIELPKALLQNRKLQIDIYNIQGETAKTLAAFRELMSLQDSVLSTEENRNLINLQVMAELDKRDKENARKQEIIEQEHLNNERLAQKEKIFTVILAGSVLLLGGLIIYIYAIRKKRKELSLQNQMITEQKQIIEAALNEKGLLLQEIHHRVKNNLQIISSLLKLQEGKISNKDALEPLAQSKRRIESMALIHQMLYKRSSFNEIELDNYIRILISRIDYSFSDPSKKIQIDFNAEPIKLHIDKAIPLGLIITEIITNSYKYGFQDQAEGMIKVELKKDDSKIIFRSSDDGIGMPEGIDLRKEQSLGLELIEILSEQLDAELNIASRNGVSYEIKF